MKVKVNINTWCMSHEAVTVPSLMMMPLILSEESLARDTHTHTQTDRHTDRQTHTHTRTDIQTLASSILNCFKVAYDFENNKKSCFLWPLLFLILLKQHPMSQSCQKALYDSHGFILNPMCSDDREAASVMLSQPTGRKSASVCKASSEAKQGRLCRSFKVTGTGPTRRKKSQRLHMYTGLMDGISQLTSD